MSRSWKRDGRRLIREEVEAAGMLYGLPIDIVNEIAPWVPSQLGLSYEVGYGEDDEVPLLSLYNNTHSDYAAVVFTFPNEDEMNAVLLRCIPGRILERSSVRHARSPDDRVFLVLEPLVIHRREDVDVREAHAYRSEVRRIVRGCGLERYQSTFQELQEIAEALHNDWVKMRRASRRH